jgi:hypothetical protein
MRQERINKHVVELYDSIDELPIVRFQKYNKYLLIDSGVGSDMNDVLDHIDRAKLYISANPKMAVVEMENMRQAIYLISEEISPKYMAFAVLVHKIDGKEMNDLSDVGLKKVLEILNEVKKSWIDGILDLVKKKIDRELSLYFPGKFEDASVKEYFDLLKDHTLLRLKHIISGDDVSSKCEKLETQLALLAKPRIFWGRNSVEISYDKQFEEMCLILAHNVQVNPKEMSVMQFYNAFDYIKKIAKKNKAK